MSPPKKIHNLPDNLTFEPKRGLYRYRNPLTGKWAWSTKDEEKAKVKAQKSNRIIELKREQEKVASGDLGSVSYVIRLYREIVIPNKPWSKGTLETKETRLNVIDRLFGPRAFAALDQIVIGDHLNQVGKNGDLYMKWRAIWCDLCAFALSRKLATYNAAEATLTRSTSKKLEINQTSRLALSVRAYKEIYHHPEASPFLQLAMDASLATLQGRLEIVSMQIADFKDDGYLYVIRQKSSAQSDMAFIKIRITPQIEELKQRSIAQMKEIGYLSPMLIHRIASRRNQEQLKSKRHPTAVTPNYLTKEFARICRLTGLFDDLKPNQTPPTYHCIRGLGSRILEAQGKKKKDIQALMTHTDEKTTDIYLSQGRQALKPEHFIGVESAIDLSNLPDI